MTTNEERRAAEQAAWAGALTAPERPEAYAETPLTGSADPVRGLLDRHQQLCVRAVDPLEIAVGLEADGLTDRSAARFRHRDVFSLAEELYARAPASGERDGLDNVPAADRRLAWGAPHPARLTATWLLPGTLLTGTVWTLRWWEVGAGARWVVGVAGAVAVAYTLVRAVRGAALSPLAVSATVLLLGYALYGDALLGAALAGGPERLPTVATWCVPLTLVWAVAVGLGCARWFAVRAGLRLADSRSLAAFAVAVRPLLALTVLLFVAAVAVLWLVTHQLVGHPWAEPTEWASVLALGLLLFLALLLSAHGFRRTAATVLAVSAALELLALALVFAARLPWLGWLDAPVELLVAEYGTTSVPALLCLVVALVALVQAVRLLTGASAHRWAWHPPAR